MKGKIRVVALLTALVCAVVSCSPSQEESAPKNLIYMIGDGMGLSHVAMMMIEGGYEETAFDRMEGVALISTYSANNRVTDSAAAGTALATGHKTHNGMVGVGADSLPVPSIVSRAVDRGNAAGIVVTCEVQHATPASFYAHVPNRGLYAEISRQLVGSGVDLILGGGRASMVQPDEEHPEKLSPLNRMEQAGYRSIEELADLDSLSGEKVIGLFADGHLPSKLAGRDDYLPRAVESSLRYLEHRAAERDRGFVLMVEGSQIDFESHGNNTAGILAEVRDFEQAVAVAMRYVEAHPETLLVVTADHETGGLTMASGNSDFTSSESGIEYRYSTGSHTGILVPVYLYGCGAEQIRGVMDNTELSRKLAELMNL